MLHKTLLASQNNGEADKTANEWLKAHPKDVAFRLYLGESATIRKDYPSAAKYYRSALDLQPENARALNNLAWVLGQMKSPQAIEYAEKANKLAPNQPALRNCLVAQGARDIPSGRATAPQSGARADQCRAQG